MEPKNVDIVDVKSVGEDTITVDIETPPEFDARPGQFIKLSVTAEGEHITRFYTLSSAFVNDTFEITVGIDPDGTLGPWLTSATGQSVTIEGPYGSAFYEDESSVLILAGGPGIGPAIGIGERVLADGGTVTILYQDVEPVHEERLEALKENGATVHVTQDPLDDLIEGEYADQQVFIYGFQTFVSDAVAALETVGADADHAKIENFG